MNCESTLVFSMMNANCREKEYKKENRKTVNCSKAGYRSPGFGVGV